MPPLDALALTSFTYYTLYNPRTISMPTSCTKKLSRSVSLVPLFKGWLLLSLPPIVAMQAGGLEPPCYEVTNSFAFSPCFRW